MASFETFARRTAWQWVKISLALLLIAYGLFLIVPRLNEVSSTDAVVTARTVMVRAPEAGVVSDAPRNSGRWFQKGAPAAKLDLSGDPKALQALEDEALILVARVKALEDQYNANEALRRAPEGPDKRSDLLIAQASIGATLIEARKRLELLRESADRSKAKPLVIPAPIDGLVWRALATPGNPIAAHAPIFQMLDTGSFYVDCSVHRDDIQYIQPGGKAAVKVLGQAQAIEGIVEVVLSPTSYDEQVDFAIAGPRVRSNEYRVLVRLPPPADPMGAAALGVGVRATVVFGHRVRFLENLLTLSR